jgi:hypothetical protein
MKSIVGAGLIAALLFTPLAAKAEVVNLVYSGQPTGLGEIYGVTGATGSGILTIPDGTTSAGFDDIASFSFTLTLNGVDSNNNPISDTDTFTLADLDPSGQGFPQPGFSATLDSSGNILSLSLTTDTPRQGYWFPDQSLDFTLGGDSTTGNFDAGTMTSGPFTASVAAPEPASLALLGGGLAMLGLRRRKRAGR